MNRFSRWLGGGCLAVGAAGLAGCSIMDTFASKSCKPAKCAGGQCGAEQCKYPDACPSEGYHQFCEQVKNFDTEQLHPDHCWPEQYSRESARRVNAPFGQQMRNGTDIEMTIWEHYFESDETGKPSDRLNEAGRRRIQYFARRRPYVVPSMQLQTSFSRPLDQRRVAAVIAAANSFSLEAVPWDVTIVDRAPTGLFGPEGPKAITKMVGPGAGPPAYEKNIKADFLSGPSTGSAGGTSSGS